MHKAPLAIYIHWPFCLSKCPYCDFNSRPLQEGLDHQEWAEAYVFQLKDYAQRLPDREITSIYFGGGTPSLMLPETVSYILNTIAKEWHVTPSCEITLEVNPTSVLKEKLDAFHAAGVNRISLGVQSFDDQALQFLGRKHSTQEACQAIDLVASLYPRFSFDLIYARAGQTMQAWKAELQQALQFNPKHLSVYQLTIEPRTPFYKKARREKLDVDETLASELYELTQDVLRAAGLPAYEISNHAVQGQESQHNLTYWHYDDYIGVGPGAHGRFKERDVRWATVEEAVPQKWLAQKVRYEQEVISKEDAMREALMMGLRLRDGINQEHWANKFQKPLNSFVSQEKIQVLVAEGIAEERCKVLALSDKGRQKLDAVLNYLL